MLRSNIAGIVGMLLLVLVPGSTAQETNGKTRGGAAESKTADDLEKELKTVLQSPLKGTMAEAAARVQLTERYMQEKRWQDGLSNIHPAVTILRHLKDVPAAGARECFKRALFAQALCTSRQYKYGEAQQLLQQYLDEFQGMLNPREEADARHELALNISSLAPKGGEDDTRADMLTQAEQQFKEARAAIERSSANEDVPVRVGILADLAICYIEQGRTEQAAELYQLALEAARNHPAFSGSSASKLVPLLRRYAALLAAKDPKGESALRDEADAIERRQVGGQ